MFGGRRAGLFFQLARLECGAVVIPAKVQDVVGQVFVSVDDQGQNSWHGFKN